jgi:hypothetical protein
MLREDYKGVKKRNKQTIKNTTYSVNCYLKSLNNEEQKQSVINTLNLTIKAKEQELEQARIKLDTYEKKQSKAIVKDILGEKDFDIDALLSKINEFNSMGSYNRSNNKIASLFIKATIEFKPNTELFDITKKMNKLSKKKTIRKVHYSITEKEDTMFATVLLIQNGIQTFGEIKRNTSSTYGKIGKEFLFEELSKEKYFELSGEF